MNTARLGPMRRLRAVVGRSRETGEAAGPAVGARLLDSGVFDREFYEAQTGLRFASDADAVVHCLTEGAGVYSPHPLVDYAYLHDWQRDRLREVRTAAPLLEHLRRGGSVRPIGPFFDPEPMAVTEQEALEHPAGALGLFLADADESTELPGRPGAAWGGVRRRLIEEARRTRDLMAAEPVPPVDWASVRAGLDRRVPGRVSAVIPTWNDSKMTHRAVAAVLRNDSGLDLEVVVVDNGSRYDVALSLRAVFGDADRVRLLRSPTNLNFATGSNVGVARSSGEFVLFLNNDTAPRPGWLPPLLEALQDPSVLGAQPLLQYPDDAIQTAGTVFPLPGQLPTHFLVGHPPEDADRMVGRDFTAVTAAALAMRARDVAALEGFDPVYVNGMEDVDLCLRAREMRPGSFRVVTASRVTHHESQTEGRGVHITANRRMFMRRWAGRLPTSGELHRWSEAGFDIAHFGPDGSSVPAPKPRLVRPRGSGTRPLRWGLQLPSPGSERGDVWGDTHFGASLARALGDLGHEVVTHRRGAHLRPATAYDDVVVGIRGLEVIYPVAGKVNVLWVISHPDEVDPEELTHFDVVYAASPLWAAQMTQRCGREVGVLLQATDTALRPDRSTTPLGDGSVPVFVGRAAAGRARPIVDAVVATGVRAVVHGPEWAGLIPPAYVGRPVVPHEELSGLYRRHGLVLADHWADMARAGFVSNRIYDAVAAGARVVCDPVPGLEEFEGAAQTFSSREELAYLCSPEGRGRFPSDDELAAIADRVAERHSFHRRAEQLSEAVQTVLASR